MYYFYAQTEKGLKSPKNNDCFFIDDYISQEQPHKIQSKRNEFLLGIADGVGSSVYGGEAAKYILEQLSKYRKQITHALILNIIQNAHTYLNKTFDYQSSTVFTILHIQKSFITMYHLGDTRAYKLTSNNNFVSLTNDHSYVQKLINDGVISESMRYTHPQKNLILQSLGGKNNINIDIYKNSFEPGEQLLLTTDGIHDYLNNQQMKEILLSSKDIKTNVSKLITTAKAHQSKDDLTAIIIKYI